MFCLFLLTTDKLRVATDIYINTDVLRQCDLVKYIRIHVKIETKLIKATVYSTAFLVRKVVPIRVKNKFLKMCARNNMLTQKIILGQP